MSSRLHMQGTSSASETNHGQYLSFQMAGETYAIHILSIREIMEYEHLTRVPLIPDFIRGVMNLRGSVVPVIDLAVRFGQPPTAIDRRTCIIIVSVQDEVEGNPQLIGVLVDAVHEVLSIDPETIEPPPPFGSRVRTDFITGMARMDNHFTILLDVERVLSLEEITLLASLDTSASAGDPSAAPHAAP